MSASPILKPDGSNTTTIAEPGIMSDEHITETMDSPTVTTEALAEQSVVMMGDMMTEAMTMGEVTVVADACGELVVSDEQLMEIPTASEPSMVVEVDPLGCSMSACVSADEAVLSAGSVTPSKSAPITPVTPLMEFHSAEESSPSVSGVHEVSEECDLNVSAKRKVVGRKKAVVDDDGESKSSASSDAEDNLTTASSSRTRNKGIDEEVLTAASSSKVRKGIKRGRGTKDKDWKYERKTEEESSEERTKKKKGKKRVIGKKDTPEELSDGECGEPKGVVDLVLEDMTSSVLGGAIMEWVNRVEEIRVKSKKFQGRLSGEMKKCMFKIKEGTALLVARSEATGDPQFLRMRNSELGTQLRESENENARLKEQLRKVSLGPSPPRRKRKIEKVEDEVDVPQAAPAILATPKRTVAVKAPVREEFPPLAQRPPRVVASGSGSARVPTLMPNFTTAVFDSGTETCAEAYFTRHIEFLTEARELERQKRKQRGREPMGPHEERKKEARNVDRRGDAQDRGQKVGPRIISDIQVAPPYMSRVKEGTASSAVSGSDTEWRVVDGRRKRRGGNANDASLFLPPFSAARRKDVLVEGRNVDRVERRPPPPKQQLRARPPRSSRSSAVTITGRVEGFCYASALKGAREHIDLEALGIRTSRVRKAINGGLLIEVTGEDSKTKAEELMTRLRDVLKDSAAVSCPTKKREVRVIGFDESVTKDEIADAMCSLGGCSKAEIRTGPIRTMRNGLGTVWAQLPVAAAFKVADEGRLRIGWTVARVELLKARPLQCFRCWSYGHVQSMCNSVVDRRGACFGCGQKGHVVGDCRNTVHCAVCHDAGLVASHRLGGPQCAMHIRQEDMPAVRRPLTTDRDNV